MLAFQSACGIEVQEINSVIVSGGPSEGQCHCLRWLDKLIALGGRPNWGASSGISLQPIGGCSLVCWPAPCSGARLLMAQKRLSRVSADHRQCGDDGSGAPRL